MDRNDIIKLAVDLYHGRTDKFSVEQSMDTLRQALVAANGGSTKLSYKKVRDGECKELFAIVEEILARTVIEGLQGDEAFMALVDFRNVAEGDENLFVVEDNNLFVVDDTADGTQAVRRQRLGGSTETKIPTSFKTVRIYEELNRVLAGRIDFNQMIAKVGESFRQRLLNDIYTLWTGAVADDFGGTVYFPVAGSYDEETLLNTIAHVEAAANGQTAHIICTKKAARKLKATILADEAKGDLYNLGYYGKFYGTDVITVPQRHKVGSTEFVLNDDIITIIAGNDKPIKVVYEGDPLVILGNPTENMDLTQEYFYGIKYGLGIVLAGGNAGVGRYELT